MRAHGPKDIYNHATGHKGFDYTRITGDVVIGTNMCCQFGFSKELLAKGVRADISLEKDRTDAPDGVDYFLWLPTENRTAPSPQALEVGVMFLDVMKRNNIKTYIHCKNGHGRAPTLFAAYLVSRGMGVKEAVASIAAKRPAIHLVASQMRALQKFKASLPKRANPSNPSEK